jgi:hypothetical protein
LVHYKVLIRTRARKKRGEHLAKERLRHLAVFDVDGLEDGGVEAPSHPQGGFHVRVVAVPGQLNSEPEDLLPAFEVGLCNRKLGFGRLLLRRDAILLPLKEIKRDRVRVVGPKQFLSLRLQTTKRLGQGDSMFGSTRLAVLDLLFQLFAQTGSGKRACRSRKSS